jgi:hypothetical protein
MAWNTWADVYDTRPRISPAGPFAVLHGHWVPTTVGQSGVTIVS